MTPSLKPAPDSPLRTRPVWAWALYDWANSAFATVVLAGFFPLLFQDYWSADLPATEANLRLGWANAAGSLVIVVLAPVLGAVADRMGWKKRLLAAFAVCGILATAALGSVPQGHWLAAAALYAFATVGFMGANVFYDALLVSVAPASRWHAVSGLGFGLGYLGGGLLYLGCVLMALNPQVLGFPDSTAAALAAFQATAAWWAVFALPLFRYVGEPGRSIHDGRHALTSGLAQVRDTLGHLRAYRMAAMFLLAYWLYIDAVDTVVRMAVAYGRALGFGRDDLILALLLVQFVGFPAAVAYGYLGERIGPKRGIYAGLAVYVAVCVWGFFVRQPWEFYGIAVLIGLVQGGVQALSRSYYARLIPADKAGQFFGFYNLLGKFAALIGPPLFGLFGAWFGDVRYSMLALILLFAAGAVLLARVREEPRAPRPPANPP